MNTGQILALAVGAYFLYEYMYGSGATGSTTTDESESGGNGSAAPTPAEVSAEIKALGEADSNAVGGKLNFWQWNHYYKQVTGKTGPDPFAFTDFAGTSTAYVEAAKMPFNTWKSYVIQTEGSGLGAVWGTDWYSARGRQTGVGSQRANVMEGARKRFIN